MPTLQCLLTITSVNGVQSSDTFDITVSGTSQICANVKVQVTCQGTIQNIVTVSSVTNNWSAIIQTKCPCDSIFSITVECEGNPQCHDSFIGVVPCNYPNDNSDCCPIFTIFPEGGPCVGNTRSVEIFYTIYPSLSSNCTGLFEGYLEFPGTPPTQVAFTFPATNPPSNLPIIGSETVTLPIGTGLQTVRLIQTNANGLSCPDIEQSFIVSDCVITVPSDCCPIATALISRDTTHNPNQKCNSDDLTKSVKIDALITPIIPDPDCPSIPVVADMYIDQTLVASGTGFTSFMLSCTGDYECGTHDVTIRYRDTECPDETSSFCVSVCESEQCMFWRWALQLVATTAIISWVLWVCNYFKHPHYLFNNLPQSTMPTIPPANGNLLNLYILILAIVSSIVWLVLWWIWRSIPCKATCKRCRFLLNTWEISLASLIGFLVLSKCSWPDLYAWLLSIIGVPWVAILIIILIMLIWVIIILYAYFTWLGECCPTECEKWKAYLETMVSVILVSYPIIVTVIELAFGNASGHFWILLPQSIVIGILAVIALFFTGKVFEKCIN